MGTRGPQQSFDIGKLGEVAKTMTAAQAAEVFGVSRQRIYQVASRKGIKFLVPIGRPNSRGPRKQVSRVVTGGLDDLASAATSGRVCELLVAADLMARGWKVFFPLNDRGAHDLVASKGDDLLSFEVRAAKRGANGQLQFARDKRPRSSRYAVVVRGGPVEYEPDL